MAIEVGRDVHAVANSFGELDLSTELTDLPISETSSGIAQLDTGYKTSKSGEKILYLGNAHGLLIPFLSHAIMAGRIEAPLSIVNADYHADIAEYTPQTSSHTASWQRLGVNLGLWRASDSLNWRPTHSTATPLQSFAPDRYITEVTSDHVLARGQFDVVSLDLDFFMKSPPDLERDLAIILKIIEVSPVTMMFSSSGWTDAADSELITRVARTVWDKFQ
ncbi:MAG: hypothetical protein KDD55_05915 [Bdellovibrionales bacterium]|nr:hypothetical protein [Bdellovibrionales bacterium]